jgi:hypothetical protein
MSLDGASVAEHDAPPDRESINLEAFRIADASRRLRLTRKNEILHRISFLDHLKFHIDALYMVQVAVSYYNEWVH